MEKTRVPKGKYYWFIDEVVGVNFDADNREVFSTRRYLEGNYFSTRDEAEAMARKLRAVLNGADVIEFPSEDEIIIKASNAIKGNDLSFIDENTRFKMAYGLLKWICSKIVK